MTRLLLLFCMAAIAFAQQQQQPRELLEKVAVAIRDQKNLHYTMRTESEMTSRLNMSKSWGTVTYARNEAGHVFFQSDDGGMGGLAAWNGTTVWLANLDTREYTAESSDESPVTKKVSGAGAMDMITPRLRTVTWTLEKLTDRLKTAERTGSEEIAAGADGKKIRCEVIRATYDAPTPTGMIGRSMDPPVRTFWIDPERHLVLKEESFSRGNMFFTRPFEVGESRRKATYTWHAFGTPVPASVFTWQPPAEFRAVDKLLPALQRLSSDMVGKPAPELTLNPVAGGTGEPVTLSSLKGKLVLLDFWATWCQPCREQMPSVAKLAAEASQHGFVLVGINEDGEPETAGKYLAEKGYQWLNLFDGKEHKARAAFKIQGIPALVLIGRDGVVQRVEIGFGDSSDKAIREAIRGQGIPIP